jgi:hypothetical protein
VGVALWGRFYLEIGLSSNWIDIWLAGLSIVVLGSDGLLVNFYE